MTVSAEDLRTISEKAFLVQCVPEANARLQADRLIETELRGLLSDGLQRLPRPVARLRSGLADPVVSGVPREIRPGVSTWTASGGAVRGHRAAREAARRNPRPR